MIKVLHLYSYLNITCGISKTIYLISTNLTDDVEHIIYAFGGDAIPKFKEANLKVTTSESSSMGIMNICKALIEIVRIIKRDKINIIHSHHRYFDLLAFIITKFYDIRTITSVQSKVYGKKLISYKSQYLIACSTSIKKHLTSYFKIDHKKIFVIHNFIDIKEVYNKDKEPLLRENLGLDENVIIFGFVGRFSIREKGIDILLKAFKKISNSSNNLFLLFIGEGEDEDYIHNYISEHKLNSKVLLPQKNIYPYLQFMDIVVLPSRIEPFGIVAIETGLMKRAFIGSDVDGLSEIIDNGQNGILVPSEDIDSLAENMLFLSNHPELRDKYGKALFNKVNSNYTNKQIIPLYRYLYGSILH